MRSSILGMLAAAGATFAVLPAAAAPTAGPGSLPQASLVEQVQMSRYCRRLQRACEFKSERREVGEGNCRRFRRECGGYGYRSRW